MTTNDKVADHRKTLVIKKAPSHDIRYIVCSCEGAFYVICSIVYCCWALVRVGSDVVAFARRQYLFDKNSSLTSQR